MNEEIMARQLLEKIVLHGGNIHGDEAIIRQVIRDYGVNKTWYITSLCTSKEGDMSLFETLYDGIDHRKAIEEFISSLGARESINAAIKWLRDNKIGKEITWQNLESKLNESK